MIMSVSSTKALKIAMTAMLKTTLHGWRRRSQELSDLIAEEYEEGGILADPMESQPGCRDALLDCCRDLEKVLETLK